MEKAMNDTEIKEIHLETMDSEKGTVAATVPTGMVMGGFSIVKLVDVEMTDAMLDEVEEMIKGWMVDSAALDWAAKKAGYANFRAYVMDILPQADRQTLGSLLNKTVNMR